MRNIARFAAALLLLFLAPAAVAGSRVCGNRLPNGDFEAGLHHWRCTGEQGAVRVVSAPDAAGGHCVVLSPREACAGVETASLLEDGVDIDLIDGTWEVRARLRVESVERGTFNALLYFYDDLHRYVSMKGWFSAPAPGSARPWRSIRFRFGPGARWRPPDEAAFVKVRFSFWTPDGRCRGRVWIDDVELVPAGAGEGRAGGSGAGASAPGTEAAIWYDPAVRRTPACDVAVLQHVLQKNGWSVRRISTRSLCDSRTWTARRVSLVVLPYGPCFPARGRGAMLGYLRRGGDVLVLGGPPFEEALAECRNQWGLPGDFLVSDDAGRTIENFDEKPVLGDLSRRSSDAVGKAVILAPGAGGSRRFLRYSTPRVGAYEYVGFRCEPGNAPPDAALVFQARGRRGTTLLCVEARDDEGGRWKAVVRLHARWRRIVLHTSDFFAYARAKTKGTLPRLHPERVAAVFFGFTRGMCAGPAGFDIDEVRWVRCSLPPADMQRRNGPAPVGRLEARFFSPDSIEGGNPGGPWTLFSPASAGCEVSRIDIARAIVLHHPPEYRRESLSRPVPARLYAEPAPLRGKKGRNGPRLPVPGRFDVPLMRTRAGVTGLLRLWAGKPYPGAVLACISHERCDLRDPGMQECVAAVARFCIAQTIPAVVRPAFRAAGEGCTSATDVTVVNNSIEQTGLTLTCRLAAPGTGAGRQEAEKTLSVGAERVATARVPWNVVVKDIPRRYCVEVEARQAELRGAGGSAIRESVDLQASVRRLADWFVTMQRPEGRWSGIAFIDSRGARALFAAADIFGEPRYAAAGLRWADAMVAAQRNDGGYRMGYGEKQGICYVADGGEIAMGVVRAIRYAPRDKRERYRKSFEAYMRFREGFRNEAGDIGIGWCRFDYISNRRFPGLTREMRARPFTTSCTLGAAAAMQVMHPDFVETVKADARRLLRAVRTPVGVSAEGLMWVHRYVSAPGLRSAILQRLDAALAGFCADERRPWWTTGGGRNAVSLAVLAYVWRRNHDPRLLSAICRAEWALCGEHSPFALARLTELPERGHDDWIYLCYGFLSLTELLRPGATLPPIP